MNLTFTILIITILGYFSNYLNYKYLQNFFTKIFYFLGTFIHESSHAIACILTGAKITKFQIFSKQAKVSHHPSKIPILGQTLISLAPIIGGFYFLYFLNSIVFNNYLEIQTINNWQNIHLVILNIFQQLNFLEWQTWLIVLISFNIGAMIGPSWQDLKNIWWIFPILLFIKSSILINNGLLVISLIIVNIIIQLFAIIILKLLKK